MTTRNKKLKFIQLSLLIFGIIIILITYINNENIGENKIFTPKTQKILEEQLLDDNREGDIFYNIEYSGLDISGNRYILTSAEATSSNEKEEFINMVDVNAKFYFKDETVLYVSSNRGIYNNKSLDMKFEIDVKAKYLKSELFAEKAEYSNSKSYLSIYDNVRVKDKRGNLIADKLLFDITNQKLDITSFNDGNINANIRLK